MCFDDRTRYVTRTRVENGASFKEEVVVPRHRNGWRRRYGARYYPSRYYTRPPRAHHMSGGMPLAARYPVNVGYPRAMASTATVPRSYVPGARGYMSGGRALMPSSYNMVSVTELSILSCVWFPSRLLVLHRLSTCSGLDWTLTAVGRPDSSARHCYLACLEPVLTCLHLSSLCAFSLTSYSPLHTTP